MNAKNELMELAGSEEILAISLGRKGWDYRGTQVRFFSKSRVGEALEIIDFEFDSGYGGEEGYSLYAWTKSKVILKGTYDGAEWYEAIPRNPNKEILPGSIGG